MFKNIFCLIFFVLPFLALSQMRLVKEYEGTGNGQTYSLKAVDNDLVFAIQTNNSGSDLYGVYSSNGSADGTISLSPNNSLLFDGSINPTSEGNKAIRNTDLQIGSDLFMYLHENTPGTKSLFKLNKTKTAMDFYDNISDAGTNDVSSNIFALNNDMIAMYKSTRRIEDTISTSTDFDLKIHTTNGILNYQFNGVVNRESGYENLSSVIQINEVFFFQDDLWLKAKNDRNRYDFYKYVNQNLVRITQDFTTVNGDGVNPENIIPTENYIYFSGDFVSGNYQDNSYVTHGKEICFTNDGIATSSLESVRGYNVFGTQRNQFDASNSTLLTVSSDAIYYHSSVSNTVSAVNFDQDNNPVVQDLFSVPNGGVSIIKAFSRGDRAFFLSRDPQTFVVTMYVTKGQPQDVLEFPFPDHPDGAQLKGYNAFYDIKGDKLYISGSYYPSSGRTYNIMSFNFETYATEIEAQFPAEFPGGIGELEYFNGGFAVNSTRGGIYTLDAEVRTAYLNLNSSRAVNTNTLKYNNKNFTVSLQATDLTAQDSLKLQILDTTSLHFKEQIPTSINSEYSPFYYRINTIPADKQHNSTFTLSYANEVFNPESKNITIAVLKNGTFTEVKPSSVNTVNGTVTFNGSFDEEIILFFKNSATMSSEKFFRESANIYPNPVVNELHINSSDTIKEITIYNSLRQTIMSPEKSKNIDVSALNTGVYLLNITRENQQTTTYKFMKL